MEGGGGRVGGVGGRLKCKEHQVTAGHSADTDKVLLHICMTVLERLAAVWLGECWTCCTEERVLAAA
jgi:hypothetical protein